jgi:hypothetical protein
MPNSPYVPAIVLDVLGILLCTFAICESFIVLLLLFLRRRLAKPKDKIPRLLSANMYTCIMISGLFINEMFISMLNGHLHPTITNFDNFWCQLKTYLMYIFSISIFHSCSLQALCRMFRVVYYTQAYLYRNVHLYLFAIAFEIPLSALQALPLFLLDEYPYIDYHCQVSLQSWRGMLLGAVLFWGMPVSMTVGIYFYTVRYIRQNGGAMTLRQKSRVNRDTAVITRIFWLTIFVVLCGIPPCTFAIIYYISGYFGWWINHVEWYTTVFSFISVGMSHVLLTPHLRVLWSRTTIRRVNPIETIVQA